MRIKLEFIIGVILFYTSTISAAEINGRFVATPADSSRIAVLLQVNTNTGNDAAGGATIVFGFDTSAINITNSPVKNVHYIFHNFCGGNYSPATVTKPVNGRIWINIDLPYINSNTGTVLSGNSGWTDVVTIYFDIINISGTAELFWDTGSPFWGIYKDDNLTLLNPGTFQNLTALVPVQDAKIVNSFFLEQNYPNPFNPSTKIRWQSPVDGHQTLKVYDILGNEVATLVDEVKPAGTYEVEFNPGNLSSGVYLYRLQAADFTEIKKMILLR